MFLRSGGKIMRGGAGVFQIPKEGDVVLQFDVIGTFFPARDSVGNTTTFIVYSQTMVDNKIYIDYNDGTGEHEYPFYSSSANRRIVFGTAPNVTTASGLAQQGTFNVPSLHFYQDLPAGVRDTVNDTYGAGTPRTIKIRFQKPQSVTYISFNRLRMYNSLPSGFARLSNLESLLINAANFITSFPQDFYNSRIKVLTLTLVGNVLSTGFPNWILNSPMENLNLNGTIDLSGNPVFKKFALINALKDTLTSLALSTASINYQIPEQLTELYKLQSLALDSNISPLMRLPNNLDGLIALKSLVLSNTRMPFTEIERIIHGLPALQVLDIRSCNYSGGDYDLTDTNTTLREILVGVQAWNFGSLPSFINKLAGLKILRLYPVSSNASTAITAYGNFQNCINLEQLDILRCSALTTDVPAWWSNFTKLRIINAYTSFNSQARMDTWVNNFYAFVVANASMASGSTKFRNMVIAVYSTNGPNDISQSVRPTGVYQQPLGYVQGTNNGTPSTPMAKIWVLTFQYGHTWTVKP